MNLFDKIIALLEAKFPGVRKDGLREMARSLALTLDTEQAASDTVNKLSEDAVKQFVDGWRKDADTEITKANSTYESGLRKKYDFVEKNQVTPENPPAPGVTPAPGQFDPEAVKKLIEDSVKAATSGMQNELANLKGSAISATRREELMKIFDENVPKSYKEAVLEGFEGRQFADDNAFTEYLGKQKAGIAEFSQELANKGLGLQAKPVLGTPNKDGVSSGVQSYIDAKAKAGESQLGGKKI